LRVLEARFHPRQKGGGDFVVVGHVVWEQNNGHPILQPSSALLTRGEPSTLLSKLQYLVSVHARESFEHLLVLRSQFWSFVEVRVLSPSQGQDELDRAADRSSTGAGDG
jgi:hypothetical protein